MSRIIISIILLYLILHLIGMDAVALIGIVALLVMVMGAYSLILRQTLPRNFFSLLATLVLTPALLPPVADTIIGLLLKTFGSFFHSPTAIILLLVASCLSFLYVRSRIASANRHDGHDLHTNERQPILPAATDPEDEV
jgi:hypothetical protein